MTGETVWNVAKWVLLVVAAGFIGQFGKSLALFLIERRRRKKSGGTADPSDGASDRGVLVAQQREQAKIEKKRAKASVKRSKKS